MNGYFAPTIAARVALSGIHAAVAVTPAVAPALRRPVAYYLLVTACNVTGAAAARAVGCTKQNIAKHVARVERARDDARLDAALDQLQAMLTGEVRT
jgi:hypothetical protein